MRQVAWKKKPTGSGGLGKDVAARADPWAPWVVREILDEVWVPIDRVFEICFFRHLEVIRGVYVTSEKQFEAMLMICRIAGYDCI
ncbi:hypothetical protein CRG98_014605 [Punica granatum]|uniref:Uncharacterized protein n=1 Tax=Punica granatum TaxID=22663 RepID=A0A2I0KA27_PUNGR|nr:hypothetical protein CRG98_014605 [Punica granatum]